MLIEYIEVNDDVFYLWEGLTYYHTPDELQLIRSSLSVITGSISPLEFFWHVGPKMPDEVVFIRVLFCNGVLLDCGFTRDDTEIPYKVTINTEDESVVKAPLICHTFFSTSEINEYINFSVPLEVSISHYYNYYLPSDIDNINRINKILSKYYFFERYKLVKNDEVIVKDRDIVELHKTDYIYVLSVFFLSILFILEDHDSCNIILTTINFDEIDRDLSRILLDEANKTGVTIVSPGS